MRIPKGWFVLYQPEYKVPSVFDLNNMGLFKSRPYVSKEWGARVIVNKDFNIQIQCLYLTENMGEAQGADQRYIYMNKEVLIPLGQDLKPDMEKLKDVAVDSKRFDEILIVHKSWYENLPFKEDGEIDRPELEKKITSAINEREKMIFQSLVKRNHDWVESILPRKLSDFKRGLYHRMSQELYPEYRRQGGEKNEKEFIRAISIFTCIFNDEKMSKPDGTPWKSEDEQWKCWVAFVESEPEALRLVSVMRQVFPKIQKELSLELAA